MNPTSLCAVDIETTSLRPDRQAWEIALLRRDYHDADHFTVTPVRLFVDIDLDQADQQALQIGGFYKRHPMGRWLASTPTGSSDMRPPTMEHLTDLVSPLVAARTVARLTHGAVLVGVGPAFDAETLAALLREHFLTPEWHYSLVDVKAMAAGWLNGLVRGAIPERQARVHDARTMGIDVPDAPTLDDVALAKLTPPWSSDGLSRLCGVEPPADEERHTALGDARWALRWYDAMTGGVR